MRIASLPATTPNPSVPSPASASSVRSSLRVAGIVDTADTVEIDALGSDQAPAATSLRAARLDRIAAAIADGTYDTDAKLNVAMERLLETL